MSKEEEEVFIIKGEQLNCEVVESGINVDFIPEGSSEPSKDSLTLGQYRDSSDKYVIDKQSLNPLLTDVNDNECKTLKILNTHNLEGMSLTQIKTENKPNNFKIWVDSLDDNDNIQSSSPLKEIKQEENVDIKQHSLKPSKNDSLGSLSDYSIKSEPGNTPGFKRGVLCSSTPLHSMGPTKRFKRERDVLSIIEEAETSVISNDSTEDETIMSNPEVTIKPRSPKKKCLETVLQKDEVSMVLEMHKINKLETTLDNVVEENNVTIKLNNDMTIVYNNIEDRTIDEVLLRDGDMDNEIEAMYNLDREPDRERILEKANNLKVFVSNDEEENRDNFNPEWEIMKKLETDDKRYKAVRKLWMNLNMPDPKENLSSFNWRKRNSLEPPTKNLISQPVQEHSSLAQKKFYCTEVFDVAINKLNNFYQNRMQGSGFDQTYEHAMLASLKNMPREYLVNGRKEYSLTYDQLRACYQERLHRNQLAKKEIEAIHKFYNGLKNRSENSTDLMYLSYRDRKDILDVEDIITSYSSWYRD